MKKCCKNIDITDENQVYYYVEKCIYKHYRRYDFKKLLLQYGMTKLNYKICYDSCDKSLLVNPIRNITVEVCKQIRNRHLRIPYKPIITERADTTTFKLRLIGKECPIQQVFDYIAVYSCEELFNKKLVHAQASSIEGRGQVYGKNLIVKYTKSNNRAMRYAKKHNLRYTDKCKYFVKLDAKKCYPNARWEYLKPIFERYCDNEDIIWLWEELMKTYHVNVTKLDGSIEPYNGFMIGALPSMWGIQLMISFIYRYAMSLRYFKKSKSFRTFNHSVIFMDDTLFIGSNRTQMLKCIKSIIQFSRDRLGIEIKDNFEIREFSKFPIDMMGYVIHKNGKVTLRNRNFIHTTRLAKRYMSNRMITLPFARRVVSYKGFYNNSDMDNTVKKFKLNELFEACQLFIRNYELRKKGILNENNVCN